MAFNETNKDIRRINEFTTFLGGESVLNVYAKLFKRRASHYNRIAHSWYKKLQWSFIVGGLFLILIFFVNFFPEQVIESISASDLGFNAVAVSIAIKILVLLAIVQLIRFYSKNYNAYKHLEQQALHRSDMLQALLGIHRTVSDESIKDELLRSGALIAFQSYETGFISRKEGAGSNAEADSLLLSSLLNKK